MNRWIKYWESFFGRPYPLKGNKYVTNISTSELSVEWFWNVVMDLGLYRGPATRPEIIQSNPRLKKLYENFLERWGTSTLPIPDIIEIEHGLQKDSL